MSSFIDTDLVPPPFTVRAGIFSGAKVGKYNLAKGDVVELDGFEYWYSAELFKWVKSPINKEVSTPNEKNKK